MISSKKIPLALICFLSVVFCACVKIPEYCGNGYELDPETQFCFENKSYKKCGGEEYTPTSEFCSEDSRVIKFCGGKDYNPATHVCESGKIKLIEINKFSVFFMTNGGSPQTIDPVTVDSGDILGKDFPKTPTKPDNRFDGWFDGTAQYTAVTPIIKNVILTAKWTDTVSTSQKQTSSFSVFFNTDGGVPQTINPVTVDSAEAIGSQYPDDPTKAEHYFDGWFDGETKYTASTVIKKNVLLTAKWSAVPWYTVIYDGNGHTSGTAPADDNSPYLESSTVTILGAGTLVRKDYVFSGWSTEPDESGVSYVAGNTFIITENTTFYARWISVGVSTYAVTVESEGTGASGGGEYAQGATVNISAREPLEGRRFKNWTTKNSGVFFAKAENAATMFTMPAGAVTVTANFETIQYTVTLNANGGSVTPPSRSAAHGQTLEELELLTITPARTGYGFDGWYTAATGGEKYTDDYAVKSNVTLYAQWIINEYTVTLDANGGEVTPTKLTATHGQTLGELSLPTPVSENYTFYGWYTTATDGTKYADSYAVTGDVTLYAQYFNPFNPGVTYGSFTDTRGGKNQSYRTVVIDGKTWMAENLNYDTADGSGSWCYENSPNNCATYGRLYNWNTAMAGSSSSQVSPSGVQGVCPVGWHLPSRNEWIALVTFAGSNAGSKLRSQTGWYDGDRYYQPGIDTYGFSALPGGRKLDPNFYNLGTSGAWWSASMYDDSKANILFMNYGESITGIDGYSKDRGYSVRCLRD